MDVAATANRPRRGRNSPSNKHAAQFGDQLGGGTNAGRYSVGGGIDCAGTNGVGVPFGPVDGPAADLADRHLGILITEVTANEFVGHDLRVAVSATPDRRCLLPLHHMSK